MFSHTTTKFDEGFESNLDATNRTHEDEFLVFFILQNKLKSNKWRSSLYDLFTLGQAFATCLVIVASNAIVLLSTKHFELAFLAFGFVQNWVAHNLGTTLHSPIRMQIPKQWYKHTI